MTTTTTTAGRVKLRFDLLLRDEPFFAMIPSCYLRYRAYMI
jgi:hypothetical protein